MDSALLNLRQQGINPEEVLADAGYSSGESLQYCKDHNLDAQLLTIFYNLIIGARECSAFPNFGQYKPEREGFEYVKGKREEEDYYRCVKKGGNGGLTTIQENINRYQRLPKTQFPQQRKRLQELPAKVRMLRQDHKV